MVWTEFDGREELPDDILQKLKQLPDSLVELFDIFLTVNYAFNVLDDVQIAQASSHASSGQDALVREARTFLRRQMKFLAGNGGGENKQFSQDLGILMMWLGQPGYIFQRTSFPIIAYVSELMLLANGYKTELTSDEWKDVIVGLGYRIGMAQKYEPVISRQWSFTGIRNPGVFNHIHKAHLETPNYEPLLQKLRNLIDSEKGS